MIDPFRDRRPCGLHSRPLQALTATVVLVACVAAGDAHAEASPTPVAAGSTVERANVEQWRQLLGPSIEWSVRRGGRLGVVAAQAIPEEPVRAAATRLYAPGVRLSADGREMLDYVAGIPFPDVKADDPHAAAKLAHNAVRRINVDDLETENPGCVGAALDPVRGMRHDRAYRFEHLRRLQYRGRLVVPPTPTWTTPDGIDYREMLGPMTEPFDLMGAGFTYVRYAGSGRQDDSWLYHPEARRVRRLSTAQRSDGVFGTDIDLDSFGGFAANPAWFEFRLIGKKPLLAAMHARHTSARWNAPPADFLFEDDWEPRETWIVAARALLPEYNFRERLVYIDAESLLVPYTEAYGHDGRLWRAYVQQWGAGTIDATDPNSGQVHATPSMFLVSTLYLDVQQEHATRCDFPATADGRRPWRMFRGAGGTALPEAFDIATMIRAGR